MAYLQQKSLISNKPNKSKSRRLDKLISARDKEVIENDDDASSLDDSYESSRLEELEQQKKQMDEVSAIVSLCFYNI